MHFEDLRPYDYHLSYVLEGVFMVGWLDPPHAFPQAEPDPALVAKLRTMAEYRDVGFDLSVNVMRGWRRCRFCPPPDWDALKPGQIDDRLGNAELWVPGDGVWFAAPDLVVHYIETHRYAPPPAFLDAVRAFPMDSQLVAQEVCDAKNHETQRRLAAERGS